MNFPNVIFSGSIDHAIGWAVLHSIWQITLWAVLAGLILFGLRRHTAALRYKVANATLLLIFLLGNAVAGSTMAGTQVGHQ